MTHRSVQRPPSDQRGPQAFLSARNTCSSRPLFFLMRSKAYCSTSVRAKQVDATLVQLQFSTGARKLARFDSAFDVISRLCRCLPLNPVISYILSLWKRNVQVLNLSQYGLTASERANVELFG